MVDYGTIGLASGAGVAALLGAALLVKQRGSTHTANLHLALAMLVFAYWFLVFAVIPPREYLGSLLFREMAASNFLLGPLFYMYVTAKMGRLPACSGWRYWLHYLPFAALTVLWGFDRGPLGLTGMLHVHRTLPNFVVNFQGLAYTLVVLRERRALDRWQARLFWALAGALGLDTLNAVSGLFGGPYFTIWPLYALVVFAIGFCGLIEPELFAPGRPAPAPAPEAPPKEEPAGLGADDQRVLAELLDVMRARRPFVDPLLTLPKLAKLVDVRPQRLSMIINVGLAKNFYDFVNGYRIEDIKTQLTQGGGAGRILEVAFATGFNSKSAFYGAFKRGTGVTPSEFLKARG